MNLVIGALPYFLLPFIISFALVPVAKYIGLRLGIYAVENARTVHHGKIVRIGGVAIYVAFLLSMTLLWRADLKLNGILLGGAVIFIGGLLDDIYDLPPKVKMLFQVCGALITLMVGNLYLDSLHILSIEISNPLIVKGISFFWLIGITNAINLIDGLDGLSSGICTIVTMTIGILGFFLIEEAPGLKRERRSYAELLAYSFRPSTWRQNPGLYLLLGAFAIFGISIQVFMPYLIIYYEKSLGMANYVLVLAPQGRDDRAAVPG